MEIIIGTDKNQSCDVMVDEKCGYRIRKNECSYVTELIRCSYHPKECSCDQDVLLEQGTAQFVRAFTVYIISLVLRHEEQYGKEGSTYD